MTEAAVVGGGLAGLVAARTLAKRGHDVTLFERRGEVGGRVRSRGVDGFTLDRGFQVLFTAYPAARRELDFDALELRSFTPGATLVRPGKRSILSDPLRDPAALSATLFNREVTLGDKLRILRLRRDLSKKALGDIFAGEDATIEAYLRERGFSEKFLENFAAPFYGGITLDRSLSTSRAVFEYTFRMLTEGETVVPAGGMGAIPAQLAARARAAGVEIELDTPVSDLLREAGGVAVETPGETVTAGAAVVATDPKAARELTGHEAIPTEARSCVTQHFALPDTQHLRTGGRLLLNAADGRPNQVAPMSAAAPEYAPDGRQLLTATFLGRQDADDGALAEEVRGALSSWYPENQFSELEPLATDRIAFAQFDQPPGFSDGLPAVDAPAGPVYLAGDYTQWSSIQGAMASGREAALAVDASEA
ncbi:MAG: NAD(P)/FAD-dependent oxidoreductase [Haloarculaceae archaeon]